MENKNIQATPPQSEMPVAQKLPYVPPTATFVPLKLEESLLRSAGPRGRWIGCCLERAPLVAS
jgi:hypothetical protein